MLENWLGLDIGGANIKFADLRKGRGSIGFAMWKYSDQLSQKLQTAIPDWTSYDRIAVTMTGELADCFESRQQGVAHICDAVVNAASASQLLFYQTTGDFVDSVSAKNNWRLTAASNWHAVARLVGRTIPDCIVIDMGSTTTDVIPVVDGNPVAIGRTDFDRLKNSELVYTGISRSPVCALIQYISINGALIPIAQELFATMLDVYIVLEKIPESLSCCHTADGRAANRSSALSRLARMFCCDPSEIAIDALVSLAQQASSQQANMIQTAIVVVANRGSTTARFVVCGEGAWLAQQLLNGMQVESHRIHSFADAAGISPDHGGLDTVATALAMAKLASSLNGRKS